MSKKQMKSRKFGKKREREKAAFRSFGPWKPNCIVRFRLEPSRRATSEPSPLVQLRFRAVPRTCEADPKILLGLVDVQRKRKKIKGAVWLPCYWPYAQ
jgi:hypothetical protein